MVIVYVIGKGPPILLTEAEVSVRGQMAGVRGRPGVVPGLDVPVHYGITSGASEENIS